MNTTNTTNDVEIKGDERWIKQIIRRKMITRVKESKKKYTRKDKKWKKEL